MDQNPNQWYNFGGQHPHHHHQQQQQHHQQQQQHYSPPYQQAVPEYTQNEFATPEPSYAASPNWGYDTSHNPPQQAHPVHSSNYGQFGEVPFGTTNYPYQVSNQFSLGYPNPQQSPYQGHVTADPAPYLQNYHQPPVAPPVAPPVRAPTRVPASIPADIPASTPMSIPTGIPTSAPAGGVPVGIPARAATSTPTGAPTSNIRQSQTIPAVPHGSQVAKRVTGVSPIGPQWRGIEGLPNIVYSDVPDPSQMRVKASESAKYRKPTWPVFKHKYLNDNLVSGRSQRFPGQILCDHAAVKARMDGSGLDDNTKAQLEAELKKLNSEFLNVTGDHSMYTPGWTN